MADDGILTAFEGGVYTIRLNDPDRMNPLTRERYAVLLDALDDAEERDARCLVVEGAGDAFSSGGDVEAMGEKLGERPPPAEEFDHIQDHENGAVRRVYEHPVPSVAKVDGLALGDGAALGLACDLTLASERTRLGITHVRFGLSMDAGLSYLLPRLAGEKAAKELALTGGIVDAERARDLGLVNHVYPVEAFDERADDLVERIADGPPLALRHVKRLVAAGLDTPLDEALRNEALVQTAMFETADYEEGVRAFLEDRDPAFEGR